MSRRPDLFHPVPRCSPIPSGVVALIGGITDTKPIYGIYKNKQEIIVTAPPADHLKESVDEDDEFYEYKTIKQNQKVFEYFLSILTEVLQSTQIDFERARTAHLIPTRRSRGYRLVFRDLPTEYLTCKPLGTKIFEDEIEVTMWGGMSDRRGIWKTPCLEVDIFYAWYPHLFRILEKVIRGYNYVKGLDLTYKVYGHLVDRKVPNRVIGLVTEAAWGRPVEPADKSLIFDAISRLQKRGCIYRGCLTNRFMIADGKVRLLELNGVTCPFDDSNDPGGWRKLEEDAQQFHWNELDQLFTELDEFGPFGNNRLPLLHFTDTSKNIRYLTSDVSPYPMISQPLSIRDVLANMRQTAMMISDYTEEDDTHEVPHLARTRRHLSLPSPTSSTTTSNTRDTSMLRDLLRIPRPHQRPDHRLLVPHYPYARRSRFHRGRVQIFPDSTEDTLNNFSQN